VHDESEEVVKLVLETCALRLKDKEDDAKGGHIDGHVGRAKQPERIAAHTVLE
jgi:hypothetical protein